MSSKTLSVKVAVRVRPLVRAERADGCDTVLSTDAGGQVLAGADRAFRYDHVFGVGSTQQAVYEQCVRPLEHRIFDGFNATVFAYGQTGSGKTYTMGSGFDDRCFDSRREHMPDDGGVIPRAIRSIFERVRRERALRSRRDDQVLRQAVMAMAAAARSTRYCPAQGEGRPNRTFRERAG